MGALPTLLQLRKLSLVPLRLVLIHNITSELSGDR